jgi:hypothetical protein
MSRYVKHSADAVQAGQQIRVRNRSRGGDTILTIEGTVERVAESGKYAHFDGGAATNLISDDDWITLYLELVKPELPVAAGSAIKVYDTSLLRDRLAVLMENAEGEKYWTWANGDGFWLSEDELNRAEIVFDAAA